jgi:hypothetical protein
MKNAGGEACRVPILCRDAHVDDGEVDVGLATPSMKFVLAMEGSGCATPNRGQLRAMTYRSGNLESVAGVPPIKDQVVAVAIFFAGHLLT